MASVRSLGAPCARAGAPSHLPAQWHLRDRSLPAWGVDLWGVDLRDVAYGASERGALSGGGGGYSACRSRDTVRPWITMVVMTTA